MLDLMEVTTLLKTNGINAVASKLKVKKSEIYSFLKSNALTYVDGKVIPIMDITKVTPKAKPSNDKPLGRVIQTSNENIDMKSLKELISLIEPIKIVIQEYNDRRNIIEFEKETLIPDNVTEIKQKLFKIDVDVLNDWETFVIAHKQYKVQSLISMALKEFIRKYK